MFCSVATFLNPACVLTMVAVFIILVLRTRRDEHANDLSILIERTTASAGIPTGAVILWCAIFPREFLELSNYQFHIALAGLALLYCSVKSVVHKSR